MVCVQPRTMGTEGDVLGVVFKSFCCYPGFSGLEVGVFSSLQMFSSMSQESVIGKKNNEFQLEHEISGLVYFWF